MQLSIDDGSEPLPTRPRFSKEGRNSPDLPVVKTGVSGSNVMDMMASFPEQKENGICHDQLS